MEIREYQETDKQSWIECRVLSFLDSSYFDDVQNFREEYENSVIQLVAVENGKVIGFLDCEWEENAGEVCYFEGERGGVIWHLGVLPQYRRLGIAEQLWAATRSRLQDKGIQRVEVWTQDDEAATRWYLKNGFQYKEAYLNAFIKGTSKDAAIQKYIHLSQAGEIYGIRNFNFEAPLERKAELMEVCYRLHEVRVYEVQL